MAHLPYETSTAGAKALNALRARRHYDAVLRPRKAAARREKAAAWALPVTTADLAWAAGHFEGEGTVTILKGGRENHFRPTVSLSSTDREVIEWFCARWPARVRYEKIRAKNARLVYTWRVVSAIRVSKFLEQIASHLRTVRVRDKAAVVAEYCEHMMATEYNRQSDKCWKLPLVQKIRALNVRGALPAVGYDDPKVVEFKP